MHHASLVLDLTGFSLVAIIATVVFGDKTEIMKAWLDGRKQQLINLSMKKPGSRLYRLLNKPDAVTWFIVLIGSVLVLIAKILVLKATW